MSQALLLSYRYTAISKKVGEGFVASCGDVNGVSERSQQYGLLEFSQILSSQYGASIFSSVCACWHYLCMIHNTFRALYARCKMQDATKPSPTFFEIAVYSVVGSSGNDQLMNCTLSYMKMLFLKLYFELDLKYGHCLRVHLLPSDEHFRIW